MTAWILVIAYHAGGNVTMLPGGSFGNLESCLSKGREIQRDKAASGFTAGVLCQEINDSLTFHNSKKPKATR